MLWNSCGDTTGQYLNTEARESCSALDCAVRRSTGGNALSWTGWIKEAIFFFFLRIRSPGMNVIVSWTLAPTACSFVFNGAARRVPEQPLVTACSAPRSGPWDLQWKVWRQRPAPGTGLPGLGSFHEAGTNRRLLERNCSAGYVRVNLLEYKPWRFLFYCGKIERCVFQKAASCVNWDWNSTLFLVMQEVQKKKNYG